MRLIDADALIDVIESTDWYHVSLQGNLVHGARSDIHTPLYKADDIYKAVNNAPTINPDDLRPRGQWIQHNKGHNNWVECSECNTVGSPFWKCCPVCTAMMDGKEQT